MRESKKKRSKERKEKRDIEEKRRDIEEKSGMGYLTPGIRKTDYFQFRKL